MFITPTLGASRLCLMLALLVPAICLGQDIAPDPPKKPKTEGVPLIKPGQLPWDKAESKPSPLPARRIESARELLKTFGIDDSQLANFFHRQPISPGEEEVLYKILFRLPYFGLANLQQWREENVAWADVAGDPDSRRAKIFQLEGQVTRVVRKAVLKEVASVLEFDHYFQVSMTLTGGQPALICTRAVPAAWPLDVPISERAGCEGLFLKLGPAAGEDKPELVFAALRLAWRPERAGALGITSDQAWLGEQGFDVGSFDAPRARNQQPIGGNERDSFYGLLSTLSRLQPADLRARARRPFDLGPLLQDAKSHHGDVMMFRGIARRAQKIMLGDDERDLRERFGVDHYYQVDAFIPLGDKQVQFSKGPNDPHGPIFVNDFLVTLCVLKVPPQLEEGKYLDVEVQLPVVFYKIWEFPSDYVKKFGDWKNQPAPMLLGIEPEVIKESAALDGATFSSNPFFKAGLILVAVVALLGIWYGLWQFSRGDKQFRKQALEFQTRQATPGKPIDPASVVVRDENQDGR